MGHWWVAIRESTSLACFSPGSFVARSLGKQNTWSPPPVGSARQAQSGALLATRRHVRAGIPPSPPHPHLFPLVRHTGPPTAHVCRLVPAVQNQRRSPTSLPPRPHLLSQPSWFRDGRNKASFQKHLSKLRAHSDWACLGHRPASGPVAVGGQYMDWQVRGRVRVPWLFMSSPRAGAEERTWVLLLASLLSAGLWASPPSASGLCLHNFR